MRKLVVAGGVVLLAAAGLQVPDLLRPKAADAATTICDKYCDPRDPALSPGDRQALSTTIYSRRIVLHFDDADDMAWASIGTGNPADEGWLDRSIGGGRTGAAGSKLGDTTIPAAKSGWATI